MSAALHLHHLDRLPDGLGPEAHAVMAAYLDHYRTTATTRAGATAPSARAMRGTYAPNLPRAAWSRGVRQLIAAGLFSAHRDPAGVWHVDVTTWATTDGVHTEETRADAAPRRARTRNGVPVVRQAR